MYIIKNGVKKNISIEDLTPHKDDNIPNDNVINISNDNNNIYLFVLISICLILLFIICIFLYKKMSNKRRK